MEPDDCGSSSQPPPVPSIPTTANLFIAEPAGCLVFACSQFFFHTLGGLDVFFAMQT
ncbi:hypothetical protein GQ607_008878 [Colletotrichum asianum]|uniref:Uncharacterized protein n=1 Tax=Colletotrichum asianum TaxID=702518 RepID=A0A8H3ZRV1_9PEZI|nr:hypothetical protein GQ607_008878 [Colletotrichum asianum]